MEDDCLPLPISFWSDIATAPKDRPVLVGAFDVQSRMWKFICMAQWVEHNRDDAPKRAGWYAFGGYYDTGGLQPIVSQGMTREIPIDKKVQGLLSLRYAPTHWMPLTKPDGTDFDELAKTSLKRTKQDSEVKSPAVKAMTRRHVELARREFIEAMVSHNFPEVGTDS